VKAIQFRRVTDDGVQETTVEVHDLYPQMGETHVEGRHAVIVSVEMFVELMAQQGFEPVVPEKRDNDLTLPNKKLQGKDGFDL
jgi:hypothetical protein